METTLFDLEGGQHEILIKSVHGARSCHQKCSITKTNNAN